MKQAFNALTDYIVQAFRPDALTCQINGKTHFIERVAEGWCWRNEDGDCQEDFGIGPFAEAWEAQQSAIEFGRAA